MNKYYVDSLSKNLAEFSLQGFFYWIYGTRLYDFPLKKDLAGFLLQGLNLIFNFALRLINGFTH